MSSGFIILVAGVLAASACALVGTFLVLRKMSLMSDAIAHAVLPGLVAGYFFAGGSNIIFASIFAAFAALLTVTFVELLKKSGKVKEDSAIGIAFPPMFALGVFLISKYFKHVHIDAHALLYGDIEFAPFDALYLLGANLGPRSFWVMGALLLLNVLFIALFYKELKIATFDAGLAASLGLSPLLIHYALMVMLSITTVGAFTLVGVVLVVAFVIVPPSTAYLLTNRLPVMLLLSVLIGALSAIGGYFLAVYFDVSISGMMVTVNGFFFLLAFFLSPQDGLITALRRRARQKIMFALQALAIHLLQHAPAKTDDPEYSVSNLRDHFQWDDLLIRRILDTAELEGIIRRKDNSLRLTEHGETFASRALL